MKTVRLGIIGLGSMGAAHARWILEGKVPRLELVAAADTDPAAFGPFPEIRKFESARDLIASGAVDAILIATPHWDHVRIGVEVLKAGLHLLVEKPIGVHKADCERLIAASRTAGRKPVFAAMFNQRTDPHYTKLRDLVQSGELGAIQRVQWTITNWFRSQTYYSSGGWRATWKGEGGGVLLNQCPHNLDLLQWIFGMPETVTAFCRLGHYHDIEVEDDVTAYLSYRNGSTATFIASTGEAPGTNRMEIACDRGRVVLERGAIHFVRTVVPVSEFCRTTPGKWAGPETWNIEIPVEESGEQHVGILKNFVAAILDRAPLIAPAAEGIHSVELANAMLLSSFKKTTVTLPMSGKAYEAALKARISSSRFHKKTVVRRGPSARDMANSFGKL